MVVLGQCGAIHLRVSNVLACSRRSWTPRLTEETVPPTLSSANRARGGSAPESRKVIFSGIAGDERGRECVIG